MTVVWMIRGICTTPRSRKFGRDPRAMCCCSWLPSDSDYADVGWLGGWASVGGWVGARACRPARSLGRWGCECTRHWNLPSPTYSAHSMPWECNGPLKKGPCPTPAHTLPATPRQAAPRRTAPRRGQTYCKKTGARASGQAGGRAPGAAPGVGAVQVRSQPRLTHGRRLSVPPTSQASPRREPGRAGGWWVGGWWVGGRTAPLLIWPTKSHPPAAVPNLPPALPRSAYYTTHRLPLDSPRGRPRMGAFGAPPPVAPEARGRRRRLSVSDGLAAAGPPPAHLQLPLPGAFVVSGPHDRAQGAGH